jgi:hypothetical protein
MMIDGVDLQDRVVDDNARHHDDTGHRHDVDGHSEQPQHQQHAEHIQHDFRQDDGWLYHTFKLCRQNEIQEQQGNDQNPDQAHDHLPTGEIVATGNNPHIVMLSLVLRHEIQNPSHLLARGLYVNRLVFAPFRAIQMLIVIRHTLLQQQAQRYAHPILGINGRRQYRLPVRLRRTYHHRHASRTLVDAQSLVGSRYLAQPIT